MGTVLCHAYRVKVLREMLSAWGAAFAAHTSTAQGIPSTLWVLQAQPPLRMGQAIGDGGLGMSVPVGTISGCRKKYRNAKSTKHAGCASGSDWGYTNFNSSP